MASPPPRQEGLLLGLLRKRRVAQLLLVLILLVGNLMAAETSQMRDRLDEESEDDGELSDYENLAEFGRSVGEGPPLGIRVRRSPQRSASAPSVGSSDQGVGQPCLVRSCETQTLSGNASSKEVKKRFRMDSIKYEILRKLRMDSAPNMTEREQRAMTSMQQFFNQYQHESYPTTPDQTNDDEYSTPIALIVQSQTVPRAAFNASNSCYFKFLSPTYQPNQIVTAQLGIYLRSRYGSASQTGGSVQHLVVRRNQRRQQSGDYRRRKTVNASNPHHFGRWHFFEAKTLVQSWISHPERNTGITVTVADASLQSLVVVQPRRPEEETLRPFIEVKVRPSSEVRVTRSTGPDCSEDSQERRCCRYPLTIDFDAFRWDWIIAPKRYDAYYCSGDCPFLYYQTNPHSHVLQQVSPRSAAVPCCSPTQVSPLPIIYMDDKVKRIVYGSIPGMIVDRCGCA